MTVDRVPPLVEAIEPVDAGAAENARRHHERLAKPPGSLGRLEDLGARLAAIARTAPPPVPVAPAAVVAAGDHGVHAQGVTPWPQAITAIMAEQIAAGTASAGAIARTVGTQVHLLDVGVIGELPENVHCVHARVRAGTGDWTLGEAMSRDEAARALVAGADLVDRLAEQDADLLVHGEMGLANTTSAAAILAAVTGRAPADVVGPGASRDPATVDRKIAVVAAGLARHEPDAADPLGVLAAVGGLEHAALVGVTLAAAGHGLPVVLDGVSSVAAGLLAVGFAPAAAGYLVAGHRSTEPGAAIGLEALGLEPLLDLGMHLGEGTGALLAVPLIVAAARTMADVVTLEDLGVT